MNGLDFRFVNYVLTIKRTISLNDFPRLKIIVIEDMEFIIRTNFGGMLNNVLVQKPAYIYVHNMIRQSFDWNGIYWQKIQPFEQSRFC